MSSFTSSARPTVSGARTVASPAALILAGLLLLLRPARR
jgi:hypothetical protein